MDGRPDLRLPTGTNDEKGVFIMICSFWLASCLAVRREVERARGVFDNATKQVPA